MNCDLDYRTREIISLLNTYFVFSVKFGELCDKNSNGAQMVAFFTKAEVIWKNSFRFAELWFTELPFYKFRKSGTHPTPLFRASPKRGAFDTPIEYFNKSNLTMCKEKNQIHFQIVIFITFVERDKSLASFLFHHFIFNS